MAIAIAATLIQLTGPDKQPIEVNPDAIVSLREPRSSEHFAGGVRCLLHTLDGKFIAVTEDCDAVEELILHPTPQSGGYWK